MDNALYDYSPIVHRPKLVWPNGARVAFYIGLNIEHYEVDKPSTSIFAGTSHLKPDALNYGWRDYGVRVGIWRMIEAFDQYGVRPSVLLNSDVARLYPQIIEAGNQRRWAWLAHGKNNSIFQADMTVEEERRYLKDVVETISGATGRPVNGWMGPALTETFETPRLIKELGLSYVLDWTADDQPFPLNVPGVLSVPYSVELNDIGLFVGKSLSGDEFYQRVVDQFDRLYQEGEHTGRVMALALHPFVMGQAFRHKYLEKVLAYITGREGVWVTTSDEIAAHYAQSYRTLGR
ncbi:polysaccharide deacetylase family protein [Pendulispora albinea]|uniref:Polysaccharide deacetylase family protein n=1 Tax=Pendulispora albinea TaxID=2741071 RepID=A0ABZ2M666_9BACT